MAEQEPVRIIDREINNYNFRYTGGTIIEVRKIGDKHGNVLREIPVKQDISEKDFEKEISFWFMENGTSLITDQY